MENSVCNIFYQCLSLFFFKPSALTKKDYQTIHYTKCLKNHFHSAFLLKLAGHMFLEETEKTKSQTKATSQKLFQSALEQNL